MNKLPLLLQNLIINLTRKSENSHSPCQSKSERFHPNRVKKIQNEVLTIISEHPSSEDQFDRKPQENISSSNQSFDNTEE